MSGLTILSIVQLDPHTLLEQGSVAAAIETLRAANDAPVYLFAAREQLNGVRAFMEVNSPVTNLMEVPVQVLFGAQTWWLCGFKTTIVGG